MTASLVASLYLRAGYDEAHLSTLKSWTLIFIAIRVLTNMGFSVYQCMWRYVSSLDAVRLAQATFLASLFMMAAMTLYPDFGPLPRSLFFIDAFVCLSLLMGVRLLRRHLYERTDRRESVDAPSSVLIYGAGSTGRMLAQRILSTPTHSLQVVGYIDDDNDKADKIINGVRVLGNGRELDGILRSVKVTDLVVAIQQPPAELLRNLAILGRKYKVKPQILSDVEAKGFDPKSVSLYRELNLTDLLNRPSTAIDVHSVRNMIENKCVLVTGAGGSIGAELSRQIDRFGPSTLLLLDHSEFALYEIDRELRPTSEITRVVPLLMDIKDPGMLRSVFEQYKPQVVFHAAAYKHVHLVEANPGPAILNNIGGTKNLIDLAIATGTERFVNVSTDKAVNPIGTMGATKRACELLITDAGLRSGKHYSSVRFGNVLGSSGSLIPLLRKQIENGGPVTLTHADMTRYFMLIPEAVSLVLMSSLLSRPGDINVLRMGEPVKIVDLAKSLMALMGRSDDEVPIVFTGVRPGEKMFEELYLTGDEIETHHKDILTVPDSLRDDQLRPTVDRLLGLAERQSATCKTELLNLANRKSEVAATPTLQTSQRH